MLLVGTRTGLLDLDSGHHLVDGHAVTALARGAGAWHALLDRRVVVGRTGARLARVGVVEPEADIHEVRAANGSVAVAAAVGFGWSEDGGQTGPGRLCAFVVV